MSRFRLVAFGVLAVGIVLNLDSKTVAQKKAPPAGNAQAPRIALPAPLGIQQGTALDLTLTGANLGQAIGVTTSIPGAKVTIPSDQGKDNSRLRVRLEVPKDAPLGYHGMRLTTPRGISNVRLFCVDELPQVLSNEKNRAIAAPQNVPVPCVVVGRIANEAADYYKFVVQAGQRLSFSTCWDIGSAARSIRRSRFDPRRQRELPGGHNNDAPGLANRRRG